MAALARGSVSTSRSALRQASPNPRSNGATPSRHVACLRAPRALLCRTARAAQSLSEPAPSHPPASSFLGQKCAPSLRPRSAHRASLQRAGTRAPAVQCNLVQKVSGKELEALLGEERKMPIVIDFYATWCGPCVLLAKQLEELAVEYHGTVQFVKVDTDEEYDLANQLEIRGLPTLVFVSKEKEKLAKRTEGILPVEALKELIDDL